MQLANPSTQARFSYVGDDTQDPLKLCQSLLPVRSSDKAISRLQRFIHRVLRGKAVFRIGTLIGHEQQRLEGICLNNFLPWLADFPESEPLDKNPALTLSVAAVHQLVS